ncbi:MAG: lysophospholipid acyltransferase family protein [Anaerolineales bacterium]
MTLQSILNSKFSVRVSIMIGRYLSPKVGYRVSQSIASLVSRFENADITKAIRANQFIVNGETNSHRDLVEKTKNVLGHAGRCYYDLNHFFNKPEKLESMVPFSESMKDFIKICQQDQGYLVIAPHLSNFDLVVCGLVQHGFKAKVLSYPNPGTGYQLQNEIRSSFGMDVAPLGDSRFEAEIVNYLKNGGVAATGVDRPVPGRKKRHYVNFFGKPSPLPVGYITTALAADVPVIAVASYMLPSGQYDLMNSGPITLKRYRNKLDEIILNTEMVLEKIEGFIQKVPEQWLMFYPVWPDFQDERI